MELNFDLVSRPSPRVQTAQRPPATATDGSSFCRRYGCTQKQKNAMFSASFTREFV